MFEKFKHVGKFPNKSEIQDVKFKLVVATSQNRPWRTLTCIHVFLLCKGLSPVLVPGGDVGLQAYLLLSFVSYGAEFLMQQNVIC